MIQNFFLADYVSMIFARLGNQPRALAISLLILLSNDVFAQSCDCPAPGTCAPCSGGLTRLTLRYTGTLPLVLITASDGSGLLYSNFHNPNDEFSFAPINLSEKFVGPWVYVTIAGILNATIPTDCSGGASPGSKFGKVTIVEAISKTGGTLCCQPGTEDVTPPIISNPPASFSVSLPSASCSTPVTWIEPTITDACGFTANKTRSPGDIFQLGATPITYTAKDDSNNESTYTFTITADDNAPPEIKNPPGDVTATAGDDCKAKVSWSIPTATDNCTATPTLKSDHDPGEKFPLGKTLVTYTASDSKGNKSTYSFNVIVEDKTKPVIKNCPADIRKKANSSCEATVSWATPSYDDNCSGSQLTVNKSPGSIFPYGETVVTYTASDPSGNSDTCSFKVIVENADKPEVKSCPGTVTVNATKGDAVAVTWEEPEASVVCGEVLTTKSHEPGSNFPVGTTPVKYVFTDGTGKSSTCSFNVVVLEPEALFAISKVVTPDGDGINDIWLLTNIENYKSNTVVVVDRWGNQIYQASGYDNVRTFWNGTNKSGTVVPTGTYFYTIEVRDQGNVVLKKGFLEVIQ